MNKLYGIFHLNLMFSSLEEIDIPFVIDKIYWKLIELAEIYPLAIECSGFTLEKINFYSPELIKRIKYLWNKNKIDFVGGGYHQIIFPLTPYKINKINLLQGNITYLKLLGKEPDILYIPEQCYSSDIIDLCVENNYTGIISEWNNSSNINNFPEKYSYTPVYVKSNKNKIKLYWNDSINFLKFQKYVHKSINIKEIKKYFLNKNHLYIPFYGSDAEAFGWRPHKPEFVFDKEIFDWERVEDFLKVFHNKLILISQIPFKNTITLKIEKYDNPYILKKNKNYNIIRWTVSKKFTTFINTEIFKIYKTIQDKNILLNNTDQKKLLFLFSSDIRTFFTDSKKYKVFNLISYFHNLLKKNKYIKSKFLSKININHIFDFNLTYEQNIKNPILFDSNNSQIPSIINKQYYFKNSKKVFLSGSMLLNKKVNSISIKNKKNNKKNISSNLMQINNKKGGAIDKIYINKDLPFLLGTFLTGYYENIDFSADFYSGHTIIIDQYGHQLTDLNPISKVNIINNNSIISSQFISKFNSGEIKKQYILFLNDNSIYLKYIFKSRNFFPISFRTSILTFNPEFFNIDSLGYIIPLGGKNPQLFYLEDKFDQTFSNLAWNSSDNALISSEGWIGIGDKTRSVIINYSPQIQYSIPLIQYYPLEKNKYFLRLLFSLKENDKSGFIENYNGNLDFKISIVLLEKGIDKISKKDSPFYNYLIPKIEGKEKWKIY